jgi:hypothetical protein
MPLLCSQEPITLATTYPLCEHGKWNAISRLQLRNPGGDISTRPLGLRFLTHGEGETNQITSTREWDEAWYGCSEWYYTALPRTAPLPHRYIILCHVLWATYTLHPKVITRVQRSNVKALNFRRLQHKDIQSICGR